MGVIKYSGYKKILFTNCNSFAYTTQKRKRTSSLATKGVHLSVNFLVPICVTTHNSDYTVISLFITKTKKINKSN